MSMCRIRKKQYLPSRSDHAPTAASATPSGEPGTNAEKNPTAERWPQGAEMHMAGMMPVSPDSRISPYIEKH